jgi:hypothetical protein
MLPGTKLVIPAERSESRDPWRPHSDNLILRLYGSRIAACGGFRDDSRAKS